jgi:hypothetical protein
MKVKAWLFCQTVAQARIPTRTFIVSIASCRRRTTTTRRTKNMILSVGSFFPSRVFLLGGFGLAEVEEL